MRRMLKQRIKKKHRKEKPLFTFAGCRLYTSSSLKQTGAVAYINDGKVMRIAKLKEVWENTKFNLRHCSSFSSRVSAVLYCSLPVNTRFM
jgi:hypothetical protein